MGRTFRKRHKKHKLEINQATLLNNDPKVITLLKRLKYSKFENETRLELRNFPITGRGVSSKLPIKIDDILIKVPITSMITLSVIPQNFLNIFKPKQRISMQTLLSLFLCIEKHKGDSDWLFYLDSLPTCNPLTWLQLTPAEVLHFPKHVAEQMQKFHVLFARSWDAAIAAINPTSSCRCCNELLHRVITPDLFAWCYAMINTRAVYIDPSYVRLRTNTNALDFLADEPTLALCPFLDMFNHSTEARTTPEIMHKDYKDFYVLRSHRTHRKHEQIFISYGPHDNVKLFVEYGFFIPGNPFDVWPLSFQDVCKFIHLDEKSYKYIKNKKFDTELYVTSSGDLSFNLKALLFISGHHMKDSERVYQDNYTQVEIDGFMRIAARLMDVRLTPKCFSDAMTHIFHVYIINFPINIINN